MITATYAIIYAMVSFRFHLLNQKFVFYSIKDTVRALKL